MQLPHREPNSHSYQTSQDVVLVSPDSLAYNLSVAQPTIDPNEKSTNDIGNTDISIISIVLKFIYAPLKCWFI